MRSIHTLLILVLLLASFLPNQDIRAETSLKLIYVSNIPNIEPRKGDGGLAQLSTLLKQSRKAGLNILFLHGGDSLGPSTLSSFDRGAHMVDLLNTLGTSCMAVAKREFSYYEDELTLRTSEAEFPFVSANIYDPLNKGNLEGIQTGYLFNVSGVNIGVTSIVSPEVISNYQPKRITLINSDTAVHKAAAELRNQGADLVILMTDYSPPFTSTWLQKGIVDLVFINSTDNTDDQFVTMNNRMIASKSRNLGTAMAIQVDVHNQDGKQVITYSGKSIDLKSYNPDKAIQERIDEYLGMLSVLLNKKIGTFGTRINTLRQFVRSQESQFGNLVADALRQTFKADVGLFNGGNIRGNRVYEKGETITRKTIQQELPFRNTAIVLKLTGQQLLQALENGFSRLDEFQGRFPQVSGMKIVIAPNAPAGHRIRSVTIAGEPLVSTAQYRVATTTFLASGGDGYDSLTSAQRLQETVGEQIIADVVSDYISKRQVVSPVIEGRIQQVAN